MKNEKKIMWVFLCQKYGKFRWSFSSSTNPQIVRSVCIHKYTSSQSWRCYKTFKNSKIRGKKRKWRKSSIFNLWSNPSPHQITILVSLDDLESLKKICGCCVGCSRCWSVCVTIIPICHGSQINNVLGTADGHGDDVRRHYGSGNSPQKGIINSSQHAV